MKEPCPECYVSSNRATPLLHPEDCLLHHTQYICGTCGRCICIEREPKRGLQRWNFPFKSADIAKLYLRTADHTMRHPCGIYELKDDKGRLSYKIFADETEAETYLKKNKTKTCTGAQPLFRADTYREFPGTQVRRLSTDEVARYLADIKSRNSC